MHYDLDGVLDIKHMIPYTRYLILVQYIGTSTFIIKLTVPIIR